MPIVTARRNQSFLEAELNPWGRKGCNISISRDFNNRLNIIVRLNLFDTLGNFSDFSFNFWLIKSQYLSIFHHHPPIDHHMTHIRC